MARSARESNEPAPGFSLTDVVGNTQPDQVPFNEQGYLFNQPLPHPIRVT